MSKDKLAKRLDMEIRALGTIDDRLEKCEEIIAELTAKREPPNISIPPRSVDHDLFIIATIQDARAQLAEANAELEKVKAEIHKYKPDSEMLGMLQEVDGFIALTEQLDQHPDDYDGPCLCAECWTYL